MGITQGIIDASVAAAEEAGVARITTIRVSIGDLTEVVEDALHFAFQALRAGTSASDATLEVTMVTPRSLCSDCGLEYDHDRFQMVCPGCGSLAVTLLQGRELQVDSIEADDEPSRSVSGAAAKKGC